MAPPASSGEVGTSPEATSAAGPGRIAFTQESTGSQFNVYTMNPDGSGLTLLRSGGNPLVVSGGDRFAAVVRWSPDGGRLAVTTSSAAGAFETIVNADGSGRRDLQLPDPTLNLRCLAWSRDGLRLACQGSAPAKPERDGLYTVRTSDGGGLQHLTSDAGGDVPGDYSPDGAQIVYVSHPYSPVSLGQLWVCDADGGNARKITDTLVGYDVSWSPDGRWIAGDANGALLIFDLTNLAVPPRQLVLPNGAAAAPRWSPDGSQLTYQFIAANATTPDVYVVNLDGSSPRRLTTSPDPDDSPDWGRDP
jgi:Tol biopolymer transport system component